MENRTGYRDPCIGCTASRIEKGRLVCRDRGGIFYGMPVGSIVHAPCSKQDKRCIKERRDGEMDGTDGTDQ